MQAAFSSPNWLQANRQVCQLISTLIERFWIPAYIS